MGCGLRKLKPSEESSPGKIYSTLKRPQVETKVGVAYTYRYLDFIVGKDDGTSTLRLSSIRELPAQLQELYQQGFILAAAHPFIHPCGPDSVSLQHQLYRAVLIRLNDGLEKSQPQCAPYHLQLEECLSADQVPTPELIQGYVKKQIQDASDQGVMFVGFIQEPHGTPGPQTREPETPSLSLHSSPSSVLGSLSSRSPSSPGNHGEPGSQDQAMDTEANEGKNTPCGAGEGPLEEGESQTGNTGGSEGTGGESDHDGESSLPVSPSKEGDRDHNQELTEEDALTHNNNKANATEMKERPRCHTQRTNGVELLALFNHPAVCESQLKYFTVKVPLRVQLRDEGVKGVEANWLDHMTQHFNNGASLVDGYFHLGSDNDLLPKSVESVFIFQEGTEGDSSATATTYDAIVVEQWTVIDGLQVKTDYVPLLQSLAVFGWRLTCVLPTPIIKANSDGSLATKQIVFLQRPVLPRKKRESKKLIFKTRSKSNKNSIKDAPKNKKKKNKLSAEEKEVEDPKILDDEEKTVKEGSKSVNETEERKEETVRERETKVETVCKEGEGVEETEEGKEGEMEAEDRTESRVGTGEEKDGGAGTEDKGGEEGRTEKGEGGGVETEHEREGEKKKGEEPVNGEVEDGTETTKVVEGEVNTKEEKKEGEAEMGEVKENGDETEVDKKPGGVSRESENTAEQQDTPQQQQQVEVHKEVADDGQVTMTNQNPEDIEGSSD